MCETSMSTFQWHTYHTRGFKVQLFENPKQWPPHGSRISRARGGGGRIQDFGRGGGHGLGFWKRGHGELTPDCGKM